MNEPDYRTLLTLLDSAKLLLAKNAGALNPADLRIRSLVSITGKEAQRALLELKAAARLVSVANAENHEKPTAPPAHTHSHSTVVVP